jgi:small subunit ribosomal protein S19e
LPTPHDVPASLFIPRLAKYIKDNIDQVQPPPWAPLVKTSSHTQSQPDNSDWWFTRAASILRKTYIEGPIGLEHLRAEYGGRKSFGVRRQHTRKGGGTNIRKILQQLEAARLVETIKGKGRTITKEGRKILDHTAAEIKEELEKKQPELKKYP